MKSKIKAKGHTRSEEEQEQKPFPHLPESVICNILSKLPAEDLHEKFRYICKSWHAMISSRFFSAWQNANQETHELLIQVPVRSSGFKTASLVMEDKGLDFKLNDNYTGRMGRISSSCNGLLLVNDPKSKLLHVLNLVTKCRITLPPCGSQCPHQDCGSALTFDPCKEEYKVVHINDNIYGFEIYTIGCPHRKWKKIPGPFQKYDYIPYDIASFSWSDPERIKGTYLHWYVESNQYLISMDVNEETSRKTYLPKDEIIEADIHAFLELGGHLAFFNIVSSSQMDIWILEDYKAQIWYKKHSIVADLVDYINRNDSSVQNRYDGALPDFTKLVTVATLRNGEIIMFRHQKDIGDRLYLYDMKERKLKKFKVNIKYSEYFISHKSSVISWKNEEELMSLRQRHYLAGHSSFEESSVPDSQIKKSMSELLDDLQDEY